jgi:hypothetical protein
MKSPGSSGSAPNIPQPQGNVTPYGQSSRFNPQYQSFLPEGGNDITAQLSDPVRMEGGPPTPLLQQQEATPVAAAPIDQSNDLKKLLSQLMMRGQSGGGYGQGVSRGGGDRGSGGGGSTQGGPGGFGGSSARSGGLY